MRGALGYKKWDAKAACLDYGYNSLVTIHGTHLIVAVLRSHKRNT